MVTSLSYKLGANTSSDTYIGAKLRFIQEKQSYREKKINIMLLWSECFYFPIIHRLKF